jgi:hypothetical protein
LTAASKLMRFSCGSSLAESPDRINVENGAVPASRAFLR